MCLVSQHHTQLLTTDSASCYHRMVQLCLPHPSTFPSHVITSTAERIKQAPVCICEQYLSTVGICYNRREGVGRKKLALEADWPTSTIRCYLVHSLQSLAHTAANPPAWEQPTGEHRCFPAKFRGRGTQSCATARRAQRNSGIRLTGN
jgi:hypothetical protein